jgi:hypothetical protein
MFSMNILGRILRLFFKAVICLGTSVPKGTSRKNESQIFGMVVPSLHICMNRHATENQSPGSSVTGS